MLNIQFSSSEADWRIYRQPLLNAFRENGIAANLRPEIRNPADIDFVICSPASDLVDFAPFTALKAVLSLWAGVERIVGNKSITVPLCRMVDPGLTEGMVEWVTGHVLRHHLGMDTHILHQDGIWRHDIIPPLARDRTVGILGLGTLGSACAQALAALNFRVAGWSRRPKAMPGVQCFSGTRELNSVLAMADILVLLLPATGDTLNLLGAQRFGLMKPGAVLINPGRGSLIDDDALLEALDNGRLAHATLDVFRHEPLLPAHPFWAHPGITVTPHIASETRPKSASRTLAANIRRWMDGVPLANVVDRAHGY